MNQKYAKHRLLPLPGISLFTGLFGVLIFWITLSVSAQEMAKGKPG
jgi:hypothetical protein